MQGLKWYIDAWDPLAGRAFLYERPAELDIDFKIELRSIFVGPPNFQPEPVIDRSLAFSATRSGFFQKGAFSDGQEIRFFSLDEAVCFVERTFIAANGWPSGGSNGGAAAQEIVYPIRPLSPNTSGAAMYTINENETIAELFFLSFNNFALAVDSATKNNIPESFAWKFCEQKASPDGLTNMLVNAGSLLTYEILSRVPDTDDIDANQMIFTSLQSLINIFDHASIASGVFDNVIKQLKIRKFKNNIPPKMKENLGLAINYLKKTIEKHQSNFNFNSSDRHSNPLYELAAIPIPLETNKRLPASHRNLLSLLFSRIGGLYCENNLTSICPPTNLELLYLLLSSIHMSSSKTMCSMPIYVQIKKSVSAREQLCHVTASNINFALSWFATQLPKFAFPKHIEKIIGSRTTYYAETSQYYTSLDHKARNVANSINIRSLSNVTQKKSSPGRITPLNKLGTGNNYGFFMPTVTQIGVGAVKIAGDKIKALGGTKPLIVTDKGIVNLGILKQITSVLDAAGTKYVVFDETIPNPTDKNVHDAVDLYKKENCDSLITLGGGSSHDCGKGVGFVVANGGKIHDYEGVNKSSKPFPPYVAINTMSGTASEMTRFCIITDVSRHVQMAIVDWRCTPDVAINDPILKLDMPPRLTAATGMDALTHAVEAYVSTIATPMTDACAEKAIELIFKYLPKSVGNGLDIEAREMMCYAECLAGIAFNNASLGHIHAIAHQLSSFYDLPIGECNAILLPHYVEKYSLIACCERFAYLAELIGEPVGCMSERAAANVFLNALRRLSADIGIPAGLIEMGKFYGKDVKASDIPTMTGNAQKDACGLTNPRRPTDEDVTAIYTSVL